MNTYSSQCYKPITVSNDDDQLSEESVSVKRIFFIHPHINYLIFMDVTISLSASTSWVYFWKFLKETLRYSMLDNMSL